MNKSPILHYRQAVATLVAAGVLLLHLAGGTFWATGNSATTPTNSPKLATGPLAKVARWMEPVEPEPDFFEPPMFERWKPIVAATADPEERYKMYDRSVNAQQSEDDVIVAHDESRSPQADHAPP